MACLSLFSLCVCWAFLHENRVSVDCVIYCVMLHGLRLCVYGDCVLMLYIHVCRVMMYGVCLCRFVCLCGRCSIMCLCVVV